MKRAYHYLATLLFTQMVLAGSQDLSVMEVESGQNQRLDARISLDIDGLETNDPPKIKIYSLKKNQEKTLHNVDPDLFEVINTNNQIELHSRDVIDSPQVDLVLEVKKGNALEYKKYTIDLTQSNQDTPKIVIGQDLIAPKPQNHPIKHPARKKMYPVQLPVVNSVSNKIIASNNVGTLPTQTISNPAEPVLDTTRVIQEVDQALTSKDTGSPNTTQTIGSSVDQTPKTQPPQKPDEIQSSGMAKSEISNVVIAFLTGILGVLLLQKNARGIFSKRPRLSVSSNPTRQEPNHLKSKHSSSIAEDAVEFEQLLTQYLSSLERSSITPKINDPFLDEEETDFDYRFDFNLPDDPKTV